MRKLMLASTVLLLVVGQAMAQSQVFMELEVGGSNNGATCANRVYFTPGSNADGTVLQLDANGHITWAVRLHASGTQPGGLEIRGVANYVFDLELYSMPNPAEPENLVLAESATFTSMANANPGSCGNEGNPESNPTAPFLTNAAFPYTFNISYTNPDIDYGPGRIFDVWRYTTSDTRGGPRMDVHCYPKAAPGTGKLFGMGAGFSSWIKTTGSTATFGGIGKGDWPTPNEWPNPHTGCLGDTYAGCQGWGPVAEGQLEGLDPGTYVLRLIPGGGVNVQRNEAASSSKDVFALAADTVTGDDIVFVVDTPLQPVTIVGWQSIRTHGAADYPIALDPADANPPTSEPRNNGTNPKLAIVFAKADGTTPADLTDPKVGYTAGQVAVAFAGADTDGLTYTESFATTNGPNDTLVLTLSSIVDRSCYKFDVSSSVALVPGADATCSIVNIIGDSNDSRTVTVSDVAQVRTANNLPVFPSNIRRDFNLSDSITVSDVALARTKNNSDLIPCP